MLIKCRRGWELPERTATPEKTYLNRRTLLAGTGLAGTGLVGGGLVGGGVLASAMSSTAMAQDDPSAGRYPVPRNETYTLKRPLTSEAVATSYNNFYEFGSHKQIANAAQALPIRPWEIQIDGLVNKPMTLDIDALLARVQLEERLYRLRCVEAWSMRVPWSGFAMKQLVDLAEPLSSARYIAMQTFQNPAVANGQRQFWYPWPYVEGVTMAEAQNDLAFLVTGLYGKPLPKQNGAPLRIALPWKYGFKSIKSIVRFTFTDTRPVSFWEEIQGAEYGFWANVNPEVPHPRWSQATERDIETGERHSTALFNGYGAFVADMYQGLEGERLYA